MQTQNRLLDDLARAASGALGVATGMRSEVESRLREQFERVISQMDLVTREEYEVVQDMARKAREEQEDMAERLEKLEARLAELEAEKTASAKSSSQSGTAKSSSQGGAKKTSGGGKKASGSDSDDESQSP